MSILSTGAFIDLKEKENYMRGTNWEKSCMNKYITIFR